MEENKGGNNKMENTSSALNFDSFDDFFNNMGMEEEKKASEEKKKVVKEKPAIVTEQKEEPENISSISLQSVTSKFVSIENELNNEFMERRDLIKIMMLSLVTGSNLLMLGDPGTAKSLISRALCNRIEQASYFEYMLNKTSDPSEILGPFSVKEMENDKFLRNTTGKLPEANVAFIDEVYKSNAPTLNALLTIMNEHIFYNNGKPVPVPLISMFAASNEPPEDDSLLAMHDRFLFRIDVEYIHDIASKRKMFQNYVNGRNGAGNGNFITTVTLDEIDFMQEEASKVKVPAKIYDAFIKLLNKLEKNGISISDRRANECFKVLQGSAALAGRNKVSVIDFEFLKYVLWTDKEDLSVISGEIETIINPFDEEFNLLQSNFNEIRGEIDSVRGTERTTTFLSNQTRLKSITTKVNRLVNDAASAGRDTTQFMELRNNIDKYVNEMSQEASGDTLDSLGISLPDGETTEEVDTSFVNELLDDEATLNEEDLSDE